MQYKKFIDIYYNYNVKDNLIYIYKFIIKNIIRVYTYSFKYIYAIMINFNIIV